MRSFAEATTDYAQLVDTIARSVTAANSDSCVVFTLGEDGETLLPVAAHAVGEAEQAIVATLLATEPFRLEEHPALRRVVETREPLLVATLDPAALARHGQTDNAYTKAQSELRIHSVIAVALHAHGTTLGLLTMTRSRPDAPPYDENDRDLAINLADHASLALANARLYAAEQKARIAAEEAMRSRRLLEERFARLSEAGLVGIVVADLDGKILDANDYVARMLGYPRAALVSGAVPWSRVQTGEWQESDDLSIEHLRTKGTSELREKEYVRADGTRVPVLIASARLGDGPEIVAFILDLSEHKRVERALAKLHAEREADAKFQREILRAKEAAETANRELEAFSYSVAHDLRAPLRAMNGFAQLVLTDYGSIIGEEGSELLERITANASRMGELIDGLLGLSRVMRARPRRLVTDLSALFRTALTQALADPSVRRTGSTEVIVQDGLEVDGDPALLHSLVDNLVANAVKFTSRSGSPRIEVGCIERDQQLVFFVKDNGAGFDMAFSNKLFVPFQRLHPTGVFEGTGIGLATAQRIVRTHGGRIWAEAAIDRGATFFFTLPRPEISLATLEAHHPPGTT
ncbi:MAG: PAS domain S-box protein [Deltaproteobacteria bacterium]|nr:PAS domain S-box protein [Deltaproteobacteria bacterium]